MNQNQNKNKVSSFSNLNQRIKLKLKQKINIFELIWESKLNRNKDHNFFLSKTMNRSLINKIPIFQILKPKLKTFTYPSLLESNSRHVPCLPLHCRLCTAVEGSLGASVKAPMHPCAILKGGSLQVLNGAAVIEFGMVCGVNGCSPWRNLCVESFGAHNFFKKILGFL